MRFQMSTQEAGHYLPLLLYRMMQENLLDEEVSELFKKLPNFGPLMKSFHATHPEFQPGLKMMLSTLKSSGSALLLQILTTDPDVFVQKSGRIRKVINKILKKEGIMVRDREFLQILADHDIIYEQKTVDKYLKR